MSKEKPKDIKIVMEDPEVKKRFDEFCRKYDPVSNIQSLDGISDEAIARTENLIRGIGVNVLGCYMDSPTTLSGADNSFAPLEARAKEVLPGKKDAIKKDLLYIRGISEIHTVIRRAYHDDELPSSVNASLLEDKCFEDMEELNKRVEKLIGEIDKKPNTPKAFYELVAEYIAITDSFGVSSELMRKVYNYWAQPDLDENTQSEATKNSADYARKCVESNFGLLSAVVSNLANGLLMEADDYDELAPITILAYFYSEIISRRILGVFNYLERYEPEVYEKKKDTIENFEDCAEKSFKSAEESLHYSEKRVPDKKMLVTTIGDLDKIDELKGVVLSIFSEG